MTQVDPMLRKAIKILLLQLAAKTDKPSETLERIITEVIQELYFEAKGELEKKKNHLSVVRN